MKMAFVLLILFLLLFSALYMVLIGNLLGFICKCYQFWIVYIINMLFIARENNNEVVY